MHNPDFPPLPDSDEGLAYHARLRERLMNQVAEDASALGAISAMANISLRSWNGDSAHDIVADMGGIEEVEKAAGPQIAANLRQEMIQEG
jgi:hypothetical protein